MVCGVQARHEKCSQELEDLEKQLAQVEEQNKIYKMKRDLRAAEYRPAHKPAQVSILALIIVHSNICHWHLTHFSCVFS